MILLYKIKDNGILSVSKIYDAYFDENIDDLGKEYYGLIFRTEYDEDEIILKIDKYTGENMLKKLFFNKKLDISDYYVLFNPEDEELKEYYSE